MAPTPSSASYAARVSALESHDIRTTADLIAARTRFERLDGMARTRGLAILERIRALRDAEICAVAALDAAQQELDACARRASLEHMQSGDRDPASMVAPWPSERMCKLIDLTITSLPPRASVVPAGR